jgi:hypothetical protein
METTNMSSKKSLPYHSAENRGGSMKKYDYHNNSNNNNNNNIYQHQIQNSHEFSLPDVNNNNNNHHHRRQQQQQQPHSPNPTEPGNNNNNNNNNNGNNPANISPTSYPNISPRTNQMKLQSQQQQQQSHQLVPPISLRSRNNNNNNNNPRINNNNNSDYETVTNNNRVEIGLENLGNTCFMNSALQCLLHIHPLISYFMEGKMEEDFNSSSSKKGMLAASFHNLIREVISKRSGSAVAPTNFQKAVNEIIFYLFIYIYIFFTIFI